MSKADRIKAIKIELNDGKEILIPRIMIKRIIIPGITINRSYKRLVLDQSKLLKLLSQ